MNNFLIKPYDPIEEAIVLFDEHNNSPAERREYSESELTKLIVHRIKRHAAT